jgi:hypothetical protein
VTWNDNSNNETGFKVERSKNGTNFTQIATVNANVTTYASTGLSTNTTYYYRVRAYNNKNSAYSNTANATTLPNSPTAPSGLLADAVSQTQINLSWTDNSNNETGFKIERGADGINFTQIATVGANVATYPSTDLSPYTTYYYRVRAYNAGGNSNYSNNTNATTLPNSPVAPSNLGGLYIATSTTGFISIYWTDNSSDEIGFKVERSADGINFSEISSQTYVYYNDFDVIYGNIYYYRVKAYNAGGDSGYSDIFQRAAQ